MLKKKKVPVTQAPEGRASQAEIASKNKAQSRNVFVDFEEQQRAHNGWCRVSGRGSDEKELFIFHWKEIHG